MKRLTCENNTSLCLVALVSSLMNGCGIQPQQVKDDQTAVYNKLQNANYVLSQMNALSARMNNSSKVNTAGKTAAMNAVSFAGALVHEVQNDYVSESSKSETDAVATANASATNADDSRAQALAQQVQSTAQLAISYAASAGIKTSDIDPTAYLRIVEQP